MVKSVHQPTKEPLTVAYAYQPENGSAVVLAYTDKTQSAARSLVEEGRIGGADISKKEQSKLSSMMANFENLPYWGRMRLLMSDPSLCKKTTGRRGH